MKKMFVTGMNMNAPKAYIEPEMKVIEVDVTCLNSTSEKEGDNPSYGSEGEDSEEEEEDVKLYKNYWF